MLKKEKSIDIEEITDTAKGIFGQINADDSKAKSEESIIDKIEQAQETITDVKDNIESAVSGLKSLFGKKDSE